MTQRAATPRRKPGNITATEPRKQKSGKPLPPLRRITGKNGTQRWRDADRDCKDTREEVLEEESQIPVTFSKDGCKVRAGKWVDPYSGKTFTNPQELDIDHLVPLKEAHISGGSAWDTEKKQKYANDLSSPATLIAVSRSENRSKGAKDPARWPPLDHPYRCDYVRLWKEVKAKWGLGSDAAENKSIEDTERTCQQAGLQKPTRR